jgi:hypothetical protein
MIRRDQHEPHSNVSVGPSGPPQPGQAEAIALI